MKNFAKIAALSMVMLSVNAYSQTEDVTVIAGTEKLKENGELIVQTKNCLVTGSILLNTSSFSGCASKVTICAGQTMELQGGKISFGDMEMYDGLLTVNGLLKGTLGASGKLPEIILGAAASSHVTLTGTGCVDLSALHDVTKNSENFEEQLDLSGKIKKWLNVSVHTVILPYNCIFGGIDLSDCSLVKYKMVSRGKKSGPFINGNIIIKKVWYEHAEYGKYHEGNLGVTLPSGEGKVEIDEIELESDIVPLDLSELTADTTTYNKMSLKLKTEDLDDPTHEINKDTTYCFGFIGSTPITVSGEYRSVFMGDNSEYAPTAKSLTLPSVVEFKGNNTLFPITQGYDRIIFSGNYENTVAAGTTIELKKGMYVDAESTLNIEGTLII